MSEETTEVFNSVREVAKDTGVSLSTCHRRLKQAGIELPASRETIRRLLMERPPDSSLRRTPQGEKPSAEESVDGGALTLDQLEDKIRRTTNKDEAETLQKQWRTLKVAQDVRERDGKLIDASQARREIEAALTLFQTTMIGWPKSIAATLVGLAAGELETVLEGKFVELLSELRQNFERAIIPESKTIRGNESGSCSTGEVAAEPVG